MVIVNAFGLAEQFQPSAEWTSKEGTLHRRNPWVSNLRPVILPRRFSAQDSQSLDEIRLTATTGGFPGHRVGET